jgi:hypothetical protein
MMANETLSPGHSDRRTLSRSQYGGETVFFLRNGIWTARPRDITRRGIGVVLHREVGPRARLVVELFNKVGNFWHRKGLEVVHATPQDDDTWLVGSVFVQEFSEEEMHALLG